MASLIRTRSCGRVLQGTTGQLLNLEGGRGRYVIVEEVSSSNASDLYLGGDRMEFRPQHRQLLLKGVVVLRTPPGNCP